MVDEGLFETPGTTPRAGGSGALNADTHSSAPLAVRMRPRTLDELVGQAQLRAEGAPLRQLIEGDQSMSLLLWGPPGSGKTTIASILSRQTDLRSWRCRRSGGGQGGRAAIDARAPSSCTSAANRALHRRGATFLEGPAGRAPPGVEPLGDASWPRPTERSRLLRDLSLLFRSVLLRLEPLD